MHNPETNPDRIAFHAIGCPCAPCAAHRMTYLERYPAGIPAYVPVPHPTPTAPAPGFKIVRTGGTYADPNAPRPDRRPMSPALVARIALALAPAPEEL